MTGKRKEVYLQQIPLSLVYLQVQLVPITTQKRKIVSTTTYTLAAIQGKLKLITVV